MIAAPIPLNDVERLAALQSYGILDTEPQPAFDKLARLAADVAGTPMAMISLVDSDRQWIKAAVGLTLREAERKTSFCGHAIARPGPFVVSDAMADERFVDNPLVTGPPNLRFYAAANLTTPQGLHVGTLCALDTIPRQISDGQLRQMIDLADAVVDAMELHRMRLEQELQGREDLLTGLANRNQLSHRITSLLRQDGFAPFSVVYVACDELKAVNATMGRDVGDDLLRVFGRELAGWVRPSDLAARVDIDEFALLLPATPERVALLVASRVMDKGADLMRRHAWPVRLSVGVVSISASPPHTNDVLDMAEAAMHGSRLAGRYQIGSARFPPTPGEPPTPTLGVIQRDLRSALLRDELFLQYQPIVPLSSTAQAPHTASVEALVRWRHPTLGILPPSHFIPGAEKSGLILPLGQRVLELALRQMRAWLDGGNAPASVSVNVSALQLRSPEFAQAVIQALEASGVPPSRLMIELTEGTLIDESGEVMQTLNTLAKSGIRLALDDFGTGYSSLHYLRDLPLHTLKIDRTFVQDIVGNRRDVSIVAAIIAMARTLQLSTVAEGIETEGQREILALLGCDLGQGWLFGRPASADAERLMEVERPN